MPILYIIAGPNGAGKTTSANKLLPEILDTIEFVNADNIAKGISPFNPSAVDFLSGRVMLKRMKELWKDGKSFVIETTLTTKSYSTIFKMMKNDGYEIVLIYLLIDNVEVCINRVAERVKNGGHNIPADVIKRRFQKGISNLEKIFIPIADSWTIIDNSKGEQNPIAIGGKNISTLVLDADICKRFFNQIV